MSGHSKFANIKHKKEKNDAAKGKVFTRLGREIAVAVKEGGPDPNNNSKLKDIIAKAKSNNMPNDTIDRSIKKAAGDANAVNYEALPSSLRHLPITRTVPRPTSAARSRKETAASELPDAYRSCSMKKDRSSSTEKSATWIPTTL